MRREDFWRTARGRLVQVYFLGGLGVILFVQQPVARYHWILVAAALLITGTWTYAGIRYERQVRALTGTAPKPVVVQALVLFILMYPLSGWPFLRLTSLAASGFEGPESTGIMVLESYHRSSYPNRASCLYRIRLRDASGDAVRRACADRIEIVGISRDELRRLRGTANESPLWVEVQTHQALGVTLVRRIERVDVSAGRDRTRAASSCVARGPRRSGTSHVPSRAVRVGDPPRAIGAPAATARRFEA